MIYRQDSYHQSFSEELKKAKGWQKVTLLLQACAAWVGFISFFVYCSLEIMFMVLPKSPDVAAGRIIAHKAKGGILYVTPLEGQLSGWALTLALGAGAVIVITALWREYGPIKKDR